MIKQANIANNILPKYQAGTRAKIPPAIPAMGEITTRMHNIGSANMKERNNPKLLLNTEVVPAVAKSWSKWVSITPFIFVISPLRFPV